MTDKELDELTERVHHALDVPEPSPLFWDHFPNRVRAAIDAAPAAEAAPWWKRRAFALAMAVMIAGTASFWAWSRQAPADAPPGATPKPASLNASTPAVAAIDELSDLQRAELMAMLQAEMNGASSGS